MTIKLLALSAALLLSGCGQQNDEKSDTQPKADQLNAITTEGLTQSIKTLASDEFGGRSPGSKGEALTVEFIINEFKKAGLTPANGNQYTQAVPLTSVEVINKPDLTVIDADNQAIQLSYAEQQVIWSRHQQENIAINNSQLVFVGYGINAPERNWNDYAGLDVKGKTVVMLVNDPGYATQDASLFNGNAMTYYGRWDYKFDEAARQGATAAIIIHDTKPAAYPWSTVSSSWTGPQFDMVLNDKGEKLALIEGWITKDTAVQLFEKSHLDLTALSLAAQQPGFKAVPMALHVSAQIKNTLNSINSNNVAGFIEGSEHPEDVFIYMAHWDHLGTDPKIEGDGIYNGAKDNATGTAGLLELAKAFATSAEKPKRSVMFLAVTAEEQGLLGSSYYAANPLFPLANTIAGINMDGLNTIGQTKDVTIIGKGLSQLDSYIDTASKIQKRHLVADPTPQKGSYYRSDHFELSKKGVPMLYSKPGNDHRSNGLEYGLQKTADYVANNYHQVSDEFDPNWDLTGAVEDLQLYFLTGSSIINSNDWPEWSEGTEFKAIRDKQRAILIADKSDQKNNN